MSLFLKCAITITNSTYQVRVAPATQKGDEQQQPLGRLYQSHETLADVTNSSDATGQFLRSLREIRTCSFSLGDVLDLALVASRLACVIMETALKGEARHDRTRQVVSARELITDVHVINAFDW